MIHTFCFPIHETHRCIMYEDNIYRFVFIILKDQDGVSRGSNLFLTSPSMFESTL